MDEQNKYPITEAQLKLRDAATQMKLAIKNSDSEEVLRSCINSYISFARSVTLIMQKESSVHPKLSAWYEEEMKELKKLPIMKFFNEKRTFSIHQGNVKLFQKSAKVYDIKYSGENVPGAGVMSMWVFDGIEKFIPGDSGGVFRLCEEYFLILKRLVQDWVQQKIKIETAR